MNPQSRSVKISDDERTGWSSERPRRDGAPPRPADVSVRGRVLAPADRMRYAPGSLLMIVGPAASAPARFAERTVEERGAVLSLARVEALLVQRLAPAEVNSRAPEVLAGAVSKRLAARESVVITTEALDPEERERFVRLAHGHGRPRHLILLDPPTAEVGEDEREPLDALRRAINAGELGAEGFHTTLRLGGAAIGELKRIVFRPAPRDD